MPDTFTFPQARAAAATAARHGYNLTPQAAIAIAVAVLSHYDDWYQGRYAIAADFAENTEIVSHAEASMRRSFAIGLAEKGLLPVALPRREFFVPPTLMSWEPAVLTLTAPVRTPVSEPEARAVFSGGWYDGTTAHIPEDRDRWLMAAPPPWGYNLSVWLHEDPAGGGTEMLPYRWDGRCLDDGTRIFWLDR